MARENHKLLPVSVTCWWSESEKWYYARVVYVETDGTINLINEYSKLAQKRTRLGTTKWEKWSSGNFTRNWNMSILQNGICTKLSPSKKMRRFIFFGILRQIDHQIPNRRPNLVLINKEKRTCYLADFTIPANHRMEMKESEYINKYLDLARELKKFWNMNVTIISLIIGALGTVPKGLEKLKELEIRGRLETIQTTALLRLVLILREVLET